MKVFRYEQRNDTNEMGWIYKGDVDDSGQTTGFTLRATDRISDDFPACDEDCEGMETAESIGLQTA